MFILKGLRFAKTALIGTSIINVDSKKVTDDRGEKLTPFRTIHTAVRGIPLTETSHQLMIETGQIRAT